MKSGGAEHHLEWRGREYLVLEWGDGTWDAWWFLGRGWADDVHREEEVERALNHGGPARERVVRAMVPWTHEHEARWSGATGA